MYPLLSVDSGFQSTALMTRSLSIPVGRLTVDLTVPLDHSHVDENPSQPSDRVLLFHTDITSSPQRCLPFFLFVEVHTTMRVHCHCLLSLASVCMRARSPPVYAANPIISVVF